MSTAKLGTDHYGKPRTRNQNTENWKRSSSSSTKSRMSRSEIPFGRKETLIFSAGNQVCIFLSSSLRCLRFVEIKFAFLRIHVCMKRIMQGCVSENSKFHWKNQVCVAENSSCHQKSHVFFFQKNQVFVSKGSSCCKSLWAPSYATSQFRLAVCHTLKLPDTIFYVFSLFYNISLNILQLLLSLWILQFCLCSATVRLCYHVCGRLPTWTAICTSERHRGNSRRCHQFSVSISTGWRCPCGGYWCLVRSVGDHNQNLCPRQRFYSCIYLWVHS
mgnify:CR=1 FL=1